MKRGRRHSQRPDRPRAGRGFIMLTREMLESPAWQAMPPCAIQVLFRVGLEHTRKGGKQNGELIVPYDDFIAYGLSSRPMVAKGIRVADALGFLDITAKGFRSYGLGRCPSRYGITWYGRSDGTPASNRWARITTLAVAKETARTASTSSSTKVKARRRVEVAKAA